MVLPLSCSMQSVASGEDGQTRQQNIKILRAYLSEHGIAGLCALGLLKLVASFRPLQRFRRQVLGGKLHSFHYSLGHHARLSPSIVKMPLLTLLARDFAITQNRRKTQHKTQNVVHTRTECQRQVSFPASMQHDQRVDYREQSYIALEDERYARGLDAKHTHKHGTYVRIRAQLILH